MAPRADGQPRSVRLAIGDLMDYGRVAERSVRRDRLGASMSAERVLLGHPDVEVALLVFRRQWRATRRAEHRPRLDSAAACHSRCAAPPGAGGADPRRAARDGPGMAARDRDRQRPRRPGQRVDQHAPPQDIAPGSPERVHDQERRNAAGRGRSGPRAARRDAMEFPPLRGPRSAVPPTEDDRGHRPPPTRTGHGDGPRLGDDAALVHGGSRRRRHAPGAAGDPSMPIRDTVATSTPW